MKREKFLKLTISFLKLNEYIRILALSQRFLYTRIATDTSVKFWKSDVLESAGILKLLNIKLINIRIPIDSNRNKYVTMYNGKKKALHIFGFLIS